MKRNCVHRLFFWEIKAECLQNDKEFLDSIFIVCSFSREMTGNVSLRKCLNFRAAFSEKYLEKIYRKSLEMY